MLKCILRYMGIGILAGLTAFVGLTICAGVLAQLFCFAHTGGFYSLSAAEVIWTLRYTFVFSIICSAYVMLTCWWAKHIGVR